MAIEAQRYPKKENPITSEEELVVELEEANDDGGVEFQVGTNGQMLHVDDTEALETEHNSNLALVLDPRDLSEISSELVAAFEEDKESRDEWLQTFSDGLDLLGIKSEERDSPFPGASGVTHP